MAKASLGSRIVGGMILLLALTAAWPAWAATYYVSTGGSDAGTGLSAADPWRTLHYSIPLLAVNDTLIVMPGTYDLSHEGSNTNMTLAVANVTIEGQTAGTAIIDGDGATSWNSGLRVAGNDAIVKNLVFRRFNAYGINISGCTGANVHYNEIYDNGSTAAGSGVGMFNVVGAQVFSNSIYWTGDMSYKQAYGVSVLSSVDGSSSIHDNTIYGHNMSGYAGVDIMSSSTPSVVGNTLNGNYYGVHMVDSSSTIAGNRMYDNYIGVYFGFTLSTSPLIRNNLIYRGAGNPDRGIVVDNLSAGSTAAQVDHNTIDDMITAGIFVNNAGASPYLRYNMITNVGTGILVQNSATPALRYNNLYACSTPYTGVSAGTGDNSLNPDYVGGSDYHLAATSPAIDMIPTGEADPVTTDLDGDPRPSGSGYDPGCYEFTSTPTGASVTISFPPGTTADKYLSRSVPLQLNDPSPSGTFGPQIGFYDITLMRIGHWDADLQAYIEYPGSGSGGMHPGEAAWFLFRYGQTITFSGTPTPTSADPKDSQQAAQIGLKVGWNQVGNPFTSSVSITDMVVSNTDGSPSPEDLTTGTLTQGIFWVYESGIYYAASSLAVAEGGWVKKYGENGYLWVKEPASDASMDVRGLSMVPDAYDRPPAPPGGGGGSGWSSSGGGGGGGGGGCFIDGTESGESPWLWVLTGLSVVGWVGAFRPKRNE